MRPKAIYAFLRFGCLPLGVFFLWMGWTFSLPASWVAVPLAFVKALSLLLGMLFTLTGAFVIQNVYFSRNRVQTNPNLPFETWSITHNQMHNSNVDMIWYRDAFYLAHAASPFHFGTEHCTLLIKRSADGHHWEQVTELGRDMEVDVRDPKFAVIGENLFLYVFLNRATQPLPYATRSAWTNNGTHWSRLESIGHEGWLFWRPKTRDHRTWYFPAYWHKFHHNALFITSDGLKFEQIATIAIDRYINEPEIEFLPDGRLIATQRTDYCKESFHQLVGIPQTSTVISVSEPPYTEWSETAETQLTRLDGPVMFSHNGRVYGVGRAHPYNGAIFPRHGAVLAKKRTALYEVSPDGLTHISDLPSCGDTSYAGVVLRDGFVYIAYYTNDIHKDLRWLFGMMEPSEIRMVRIALNDLERVAKQMSSELKKGVENAITC
jgi:hypothetical protein